MLNGVRSLTRKGTFGIHLPDRGDVGLTLNECIASAVTSGEMYGTNATYYQVTLDTCPVSV